MGGVHGWARLCADTQVRWSWPTCFNQIVMCSTSEAMMLTAGHPASVGKSAPALWTPPANPLLSAEVQGPF